MAGWTDVGRAPLRVAGLVALLACNPAQPDVGPLDPEPPCSEVAWDGATRRPDLVLVVNDTMRRDRIGLYGGPARTPALDRLGRENLVFSRAYSAAPWTKPSIASLFTGLHPSQHGVLSHPGASGRGSDPAATDVLSGEFTTLAELLREGGYDTAAFVGNPWLQEAFGFGQGFDVYDDSFAANDVVGEVVVEAALEWIEGRDPNDSRPYFVYLHTMDSHAPYPPIPLEEALEVGAGAAGEGSLTPRAKAQLRRTLQLPDGRPLAAEGVPPSRALLARAYDRGIEQFDRALDRLLRGLDGSSSGGPAIVVTSDHGEALFERGWGGHGHGLFEVDVGVPLVARLPGVEAPAPIACPIGGIDLMATLARYLGLESPAHDFGIPLLGSATGAGRWIVSEGVLGKPEHRAIRNRGWALLREPEGRPIAGPLPEPASLFDLDTDPEERDNLLEARSGTTVAPVLLRETVAGAVPPFDAPETATVPFGDATRARLEALGYLEGP